MAEIKEALEKLDSLYDKADDAAKAIIDFLRVWVKEDDHVAEKILGGKLTPAGALNAMRDYAKKKGGASQCIHGKEAWVQVMKYFGETEESADQKLEHGLMFACMKAEMEKWRPYGADIPSVKSTPEPKKAEAFSMSLEDLGL